MNNVAQKNIIYNLSANQTMPYQQTNDVSLKANQIIYTSLNHTFRKMVDNDLFIEKLLLDKRNYQYGPKNVTSSEINTAPDGYKMWPNDLSNRNNELSIIRKDVLPVSASVYSNGNIRSKVNFIAHDGYYGWLVGADDGLFQISGDLSSAQRLNSIKTTSYFTTSRSTFAATENGLWNLSADAGGISKISDMSANALGIIDQTVFLGRNDGIYQGKLSGYGLSAYGFDKTTEIESNVNSMYFPDSKSGLAAADDGLYEGESSHVLQLSGEMVECDGVRFMKKLDGRVFIATATKLFRYGDAEPLLMASNINAVCKYGDSYYVAVGGNSSQKGVHRINILTKIVTDTAIKKCAYDVISYKDYILVSTKDGICFSTDKLQTYDVIGGTPTSTRHTFGTLGDIAFNIDGTSVTKLQTAVSSYTSLSAIQSDVLDSYYAGSVSYIAKPDGLYDSNFDKLDEWHADVTAASFQNITKSFNDGIYVFTNAGVYKVVSGSSLSSMTTDTLKQVKCTDQCVFRLNADGKLQYSENTSNFYDPALVWEDIADGVSAIDTESNALYFLKTNKVYRVTITAKVAVEKYVGTEDGATSEIDAQFIENAMAYYADGTANLNYILSTDGAHVQADFGGDTQEFDTALMKHYSDGSRTHIDGSSAQLRRIYKGVDTKFLSAAYVDFIKIKSGEKMTSMALDGLNLSAKYRDETLSNGYTIKPYNAITYFDNSNGVGLLQDNYTFFGFENGISYIKPTESSKAYYSMPAEMTNCQDFLPMPFKEDLSSSHLLDNQMSYLAFGSNQVQFAKTYGSNNKKYTKVLSCKVNSIAFDEDWLSTLSYYKYGPDTLSDCNPISVWTKGVYYFTDDGIYKNLFGVIQSNRDIREDGVPIEEYAGPRWAGVETKMLSAAPLTLYTKNLSSQLSVDNAAKKIFSGGYAYVSGTNYFEYNKEAWRFIPNGLNGTLECRSGSRLSAIGTSPTTGWSPLLIGITDADVAGGTAFTVNGSKVVVYPNFSSASTGTSITFESETADTLNHVYAIDCGNSDVFGIIFGTKSVEYVTKEGRTVLSSNVGTINSVYEMNLGYTKKWYAKTGSSIFETSLSSYNAGSASEPVIRHIPVLQKVQPHASTRQASDITKYFNYDDPDGYVRAPSFDMIGVGLSVELGEFDVNWEAMHNIVNTLPSGGKLRMSQFADSEWFYWFYNNADSKPALAYDSFSTKVPFSGYSPNFKTAEWELDGSKIVDGMALADRTYYLTENRNLYSALSTEEPVQIYPDLSGLLDGYTPVSLGTISSSIVVNTREGILQVIPKELTADYEQKFDGVAGIKTLNDGTFCMLGDTSGARTFVKGETKNVAGVDDQKITGIDWQDQLFRLAGNTGLSSTADLYSGVPHTESEYLDIAKIEKRHGENKYLSNGAIRSVLTVSKDVLSASDPVTIPGGQLSSYQYDDTKYMLRGRDYLSALTYLNGEFNQTPSVFHDKNVIAEYNDFQFVQVNEGLYCNGIQLHPSKIVDQMDQIRGSVIRSNGNELRQWRTVDQFIFQLNEFFRGKKCYTVKEVKGKIFIGTNTGWYVYDSGDKIIPIVTGENLNAIAFGLNDYEIKKFSGETLAKYIISLNNALSSSYDPISGYTRMLDFGLSANIITDIAVGNQYTHLIGTDNGLFYTTYKYALTNDIRSMTLAEVDAEVLEGYNSQISVHVAGYHEIPNSTVTYINENVMPADFSELSGWTHRDESSSDFTVIEQDLVEKILFEDVIKHVTVTYANVMTNGVETELDGITYIYKKWISGINELYVNVPSTNTYYFNHISGVTACKYSEEEIVRPNTQLTAYSDIEKMSTTLRIKVERKTFDNVQNFFGCYITGNSLPMKIYKDDTYICDGAEKCFHSYIQPSTYIGQSVNDQCVILEFKCFGTDSQSIRLMGCVGSDQPDRIINETGGYITGSADTRIRIARWPEI